MKITRLFLDLFFNCTNLYSDQALLSLHYLLYEITSFSGSGARGNLKAFDFGKQQKQQQQKKAKRKMWQLFSSYIKMELSYSLKMQRKVSHFNRNKLTIVTIWLIVCFQPSRKPSLFSSQNPFSFSFSKLLQDFFAHLQNQYQFQVPILVLNQSGVSLEKKGSQFSEQTNGEVTYYLGEVGVVPLTYKWQRMPSLSGPRPLTNWTTSELRGNWWGHGKTGEFYFWSEEITWDI